MKKYTSIALILLMLVIVSCKKSDTPKDYNASIKGKTWWGAFACAGELEQYYSVYFKEDGSLQWNQLSGQIPGKWVVNGKQLTMTFNTTNTIIKADIGDNNVLMNIVSTGVGSCPATSAILLEKLDLPLDNTVWKGGRGNGINGRIAALELRFMPGLKIEIKIDNVAYGPYSYTRDPFSGAFRGTTGMNRYFFGIITSGTEIKGSDINSNFQWQVTKQ